MTTLGIGFSLIICAIILVIVCLFKNNNNFKF